MKKKYFFINLFLFFFLSDVYSSEDNLKLVSKVEQTFDTVSFDTVSSVNSFQDNEDVLIRRRHCRHNHHHHHSNSTLAGSTGPTGPRGPQGLLPGGFASVFGLGSTTGPIVIADGHPLVTVDSTTGITLIAEGDPTIVDWFPTNDQFFINRPGWYRITYGVVPATDGQTWIRAVSSFGTFDPLPGTTMTCVGNNTMQTISTIHLSGGNENLQIISNPSTFALEALPGVFPFTPTVVFMTIELVFPLF